MQNWQKLPVLPHGPAWAKNDNNTSCIRHHAADLESFLDRVFRRNIAPSSTCSPESSTNQTVTCEKCARASFGVQLGRGYQPVSGPCPAVVVLFLSFPPLVFVLSPCCPPLVLFLSSCCPLVDTRLATANSQSPDLVLLLSSSCPPVSLFFFELRPASRLQSSFCCVLGASELGFVKQKSTSQVVICPIFSRVLEIRHHA